ncbi:3-ketodihydrosphingosine reductase isoform X2 [Myotis lucifugus]|uniref:3-ketodihydrosphingosine reductase isoform X2 n=1 Tax=Myotis lucifugus TaxID=59463 RepID=UPI000CCC929C|nr:3-ketodihydrosphingosine reductase isoform X2 [Myotis lucifugus]
MLVNCAGMSISGKFEDLEVSTFEKLMSINYLGSVYPSRAVITTMKERRVGRIVFLASQAGQVGLFGFTAYSSSKFAIKGLAEALQMEVKPYNVYVTVAYPPDTDTPGFAEENKTKSPPCLLCRSFEKQLWCRTELLLSLLRTSALPSASPPVAWENRKQPLETRLISETTSICTPEQVAKQIVKDAIVVTMGLFRMISLFYLGSFDNIIRRCMIERAKYGTADKTA